MAINTFNLSFDDETFDTPKPQKERIINFLLGAKQKWQRAEGFIEHATPKTAAEHFWAELTESPATDIVHLTGSDDSVWVESAKKLSSVAEIRRYCDNHAVEQMVVTGATKNGIPAVATLECKGDIQLWKLCVVIDGELAELK